MKISLDHYNHTNYINVAVRCPHCGHYGAFAPVLPHDIVVHKAGLNSPLIIDRYIGIRKCPNTKCNGNLFFISDKNQNLIRTYPNEAIPFDEENIPERVLNAFDEAIRCHSNMCFIASAIMIRKTLEEICIERGATGYDLFKKIENLGSKILIPRELLNGMNELRLLGNDAAHIDAQTFAEIGKEEIEVSLEFTKEILKAVYQYENLLMKIKSLKSKIKDQDI